MTLLPLHDFHQGLGAIFGEVAGMEVVSHYGDVASEYAAIQSHAALLDLSCRSRLSLTGGDRERFLNGQVTNDIKSLQPGGGCYAALVTAKGKLQADLNIYRLENELLLDFEPGLTKEIIQRLEKYIIADDVQVVDVAPYYGLLSVQGPKTGEIVRQEWPAELPEKPLSYVRQLDPDAGELYLINQPRTGSLGYDLFVPLAALQTFAVKLARAIEKAGGKPAGWEALEAARIEASIPRFPVDMDSTNLAPEAGLEQRAINYAKGCYIGQEVIARIRTYGQVAKSLRGLLLPADLSQLPAKGEKLYRDGKEVGYITSAVRSPRYGIPLALGYVRRESNQAGTQLTLGSGPDEIRAEVVPLPFSAFLPLRKPQQR